MGFGRKGCEAFQTKFHKYLRGIDEHLNSQSIGKQCAQAGGYDSTKVILNQSRIPASRGKGKDNDREGKGALRMGQWDANLTDGVENPGEGDNYHIQV